MNMADLRTRHSSSGLFLIEIIIAIGFFSLACAVCVQLFVRSHLMSLESYELSHATICAQSAAEAFKAADGDVFHAAELLETDTAKDRVIIYYDENWNRQKHDDKQRPAYRMMMLCYKADRVNMADITVSRVHDAASEQKDAEKVIYRLLTKAIQ